MALLQIHHDALSVKCDMMLNIILPDPKEENPTPVYDRKVLWLLHGLSGDAYSWILKGNIGFWVRQYGMTVIMPSAGRSFYADMYNGQAYFTYLTEELPEWIGTRFKLNLSRENSMIAGLSMGGYGAFLAAMRRPDLYSAACCLSGLLAVEILNGPESKTQDPIFMREMGMIYGGLDKVVGSEYDPGFLLQKVAENPAAYPSLYAAIGLDDDLLPTNRIFAARAKALNVPLTYIEDEGEHVWAFWQKHLPIWLDKVMKEDHA